MKLDVRMCMVLALAALIGAASTAMAAESPGAATVKEGKERYVGGPTAPAHEHISGAWLDKFHNPWDGVTMGLDFRFREVYGYNMLSLDADQNPDPDGNRWHRQRYRTRWSTNVDLADDLAFNMRWVWEFSTWDDTGARDESVDFDEMIADHFNITWRNAFDMPLTLVVGRQDIILGNGWLVLDGTPTDGSRTIFFDAVRGTYQWDDDTKVDLVYIQQYDDEDKWLQPIDHGGNEEAKHLTDFQDEQGAILYVTDEGLLENNQVEYYYMYKNSEASDYGAYRPLNPTSGAVDDEIHTFGGALQGNWDDNWSYRAEIAKQCGSRDGDSLDAWGSNNRIVYKFHDERDGALHFDYEYLSGDDPDTSTDEQFDPLWGEWPQYNRGGDLPAYLWAAETSLGEVTNLHRFGLGYTFKLAPKWTLQTDYNLMLADQNNLGEQGVTGPTGSSFTDDGNFRGQMLTGYLKYRCCDQFSMHFLVDYFQPGNFYASSNRDHAVFLRFNMEYTF